jgi:hypothetical protein
MNCDSCNCNTNFAPVQDTWTARSSLTNGPWQPYPELSAPARENYDYATSQNICGSGSAGPPLTNGYTFSNRQLPKKEGYDNCVQTVGRYKKVETTWNEQKPYTL